MKLFTWKKKCSFLLILVFLLFLLNGCARLAIKVSGPSLFNNLTLSLFEECDTKLAKDSIPSNLKILEGLLRTDPENSEILRLLSMGFCGYSLLFVENYEPARASDLYRRSFEYGLRALGHNIKLEKITRSEIDKILINLNKSEFEPFLWAIVSWNSWIMLNLDKPVALAQSGPAFSCLERLLILEPEYMYGIPYILMGSGLSARSPMLGGDYEKANEFFKKALHAGKRNFFLAQYYYARYYCVGVQDRELFTYLLKEIINGDPGRLKDVCLINGAMQKRAKELLGDIDEYFL